MIHFGLYRYGEAERYLDHIFVSHYNHNYDLCGTDMQCYVGSGDSLDEVKEHNVCEKCKRVYLMLELAS